MIGDIFAPFPQAAADLRHKMDDIPLQIGPVSLLLSRLCHHSKAPSYQTEQH